VRVLPGGRWLFIVFKPVCAVARHCAKVAPIEFQGGFATISRQYFLTQPETCMKLIIAAIALSTTSLVFANSCPMQMKEIDAKISSNPSLSSADMSKVKALRADGEALHKAGKHAESEKALGDAKKLLGM
jgi:hypothetical protein